jgi:hypothetical protein
MSGRLVSNKHVLRNVRYPCRSGRVPAHSDQLWRGESDHLHAHTGEQNGGAARVSREQSKLQKVTPSLDGHLTVSMLLWLSRA